jgi:hypothetical protein
MSTLTATQLQQQYIAYFGRPGDPSGITYWLSSSSGVSSAREFADKIYAQDEYKTSTVGGKSVETQVNNLYLNLFGRSADAAGLLYWTEQIEAGNLSLSNVATDLIWAASNPTSGNTAQGALDASALTNKVAAAEAYTAEVKASAAAILAYQPATTTPFESGTAFASAVTYLGTITSSTAHTSAGITSEVSSMTSVSNAPASTTTTLTTSLDTLTGTQYADTFKALFDYSTTAASSSATISAGDKITAGLGTDSFEVTVSGTLDGGSVAIPAADITGMEKWYIRNTASEVTDGTDSLSFDASLFPGVTEFWSDRSTATIGVTNLPTGAVFGLIGNGTTTQNDTHTFGMKTATDALTITIDGGVVGGANTDITNSGSATTVTINSTGGALNTDAGTINTVDVVALSSGIAANQTITSLTINATTGIAFGHTTAAAITGLTDDSSITVTGAGDVTLKTVDANVDTIDASAATGAISLTLPNNLATVTTLGTGDDTATTAANLVASSAGSVDAGAGTDKLVVGTNVAHVDTAAEAAKYSNFETLSLGGTLDVSHMGTGITAIELTAQSSVSKLNATQAAAVTATAADLTNTTIALSDSSGTSDSVSLNLGNAKGAAFDAGTLTLNGFETINITANPKSGNADLDSSIGAITADVATTVNLSSNNLGTINLGDVALTKIATIDASGMTGALTAAGNLVVGSTLTGSPKGDTVALGTVGSTYNGGAGADTFTGTALTLLENSSVFNTIDGGAGTDDVTITDSSIAFVDTNFSKMSNMEIINATSTNLDGEITFTTGGFFDAKFPDSATVNITNGDGDGTLSAITVSASTYTGDLTLSVVSTSAGATTGETISITTGSGADTVTLTASSFTASTGTKGGTGSLTVNTGAGADTITYTSSTSPAANVSGTFSIDAGTGADTVTISRDTSTTDDSALLYIVQDGDSISGGRDKVTGFNSGDTTDFCDILDFDTAIVSTATAATNGTDSGSIKSHKIASGVITFDDVDAYAAAVTVDSNNLSSVLTYLATNITTQGHTVGFAYDSNNDASADATIVFNQDTSDSIVELVGLTGVTEVGGEAVTANLIGII